MTDGKGGTDTATVTITVVGGNDAPTATADEYEVDSDQTLTINAPGVLSNDSDVDGDVLTVTLISDVNEGTLILNQDGSFTYIPDPNSDGLVSFSYQVSDGTTTSRDFG